MFVGYEDFSGNKKGKEHCASCLYYTNWTKYEGSPPRGRGERGQR